MIFYFRLLLRRKSLFFNTRFIPASDEAPRGIISMEHFPEIRREPRTTARHGSGSEIISILIFFLRRDKTEPSVPFGSPSPIREDGRRAGFCVPGHIGTDAETQKRVAPAKITVEFPRVRFVFSYLAPAGATRSGKSVTPENRTGCKNDYVS